MAKMMNKLVVLMIILNGVVCAQDAPVVEMHGGWCWYPYSSYYYPRPYYHLYDPLYYSPYHSSVFYPYKYPEDTGWYGYDSYPYYYYPFGGFCFQTQSVIIDFNLKNVLDLSKVDEFPRLPGSAPLSLRSTNDVSVQSERIDRFLFSTNSVRDAGERD